MYKDGFRRKLVLEERRFSKEYLGGKLSIVFVRASSGRGAKARHLVAEYVCLHKYAA